MPEPTDPVTTNDDAAPASSPPERRGERAGPRAVRSARPQRRSDERDLSGSRFGAYALLSHLGSGGMGTVYVGRAVNESANVPVGTRVAIKVLRHELHSSAEYRERFLREALLGGEIVHETVVRALDLGTLRLDGRQLTYLVMELVEGTTLKEMLVRFARLPEALVHEIAVQVTEGLSAIHAANVVHRDIKPSNILVTHGQRVRIMDLGIARLSGDDEEITRIGQFTGSVAYAAPERFGGGTTDSSADLYSLGVSLYQLVTGRLPFRSSDLAAVVRAHMAERPRRADSVCEDVSPFLAEVIDTLLQKEPADRFESAAELLGVLRDGERSAWWAERESVVRSAGRFAQRIPIRRDAELCGRNEELDRMKALWARALTGHGAVVELTGEPGVGKTRLVDALALSIHEPDAQVLYGSFPPGSPRDAIVSSLVAHLGTAGLEERLATLIEPQELAPTLAAHLRQGHRGVGATSDAGTVLEGLLVELMHGLASESPLLWIIDDLHFANADAHRQVLALARAVADFPILLVVAARTNTTEMFTGKLRLLDQLERVDLKRLSPRAVIELVRDALGNHVMADRIGAEIAVKSDGVPFFAVEMIRPLEENDNVERLPDGSLEKTTRVDRIGVPAAVRALLEARLTVLEPEDRSLLDLAAVLGFEFDADCLAQSFNVPRIHVLRRLADIARRTQVVRPSGRLFRFDHHQIQETIYADLQEALREEYHALAARYVCAAHGVSLDAPDDIAPDAAVMVVRHALRGPDPQTVADLAHLVCDRLEKACRYADAHEMATLMLERGAVRDGVARATTLCQSGVLLRSLGRLDEAVSATRQAIELAKGCGSPELVTQCYCELASTSLSIGAVDDAVAAAKTAIASYDDDTRAGIQAFAHQLLGDACMYRGQANEALGHFRTGSKICIDADERPAIPDSLLALGRAHLRLGEPNKTIELARRAMQIARELERPVKVSDCLGLIAGAILELGRSTEALPHLRKQMEILQRVGARDRLCIATSNVAAALFEAGQCARSRSYFARQLQLARELGDRARELTGCVNLSLVHAALGHIGEAIEFADTAKTLADVLDLPPRSAIAHTTHSSLYRLLGRADLAAVEADAAEKLGATVGDAWITGMSTVEIARVRLDLGQRDEARALLSRAVETFEKSNNAAFECQARVLLGRIALESGDRDGAVRELRVALDLGTTAQRSDTVIIATALLVATGDRTPDEADACFRAHTESLGIPTRIEAHFVMYRACKDATHVQAAHALLTQLAATAPSEHRESLLHGNPVHAAICREFARIS